MTRTPLVTVAVPTLNEAATIATVLSQLLASDDGVDIEIVVVDGGSTDGTQAIVSEFSEADPRVRLLHNPGRIQSIGVNLVAKSADPRSEVLVRADAHCAYPLNFVSRVAGVLMATGAKSVAVPMLTVGEEGTFQQSVAEAQNSALGNGGAAHREGSGSSGWVDHGHHAAFDLETFLALGGYDETFPVNEDAEYDVRLAKAGGRIWLDRDAMVDYFPRRSAWSLAKQYFRYGQWRCRTVFKHTMRPRARQMAPLVAFWAMVLAVVAAPAYPPLALPGMIYVAACLAFCATKASESACNMFLALLCMHLPWGAGFSLGICREAARRAFPASRPLG